VFDDSNPLSPQLALKQLNTMPSGLIEIPNLFSLKHFGQVKYLEVHSAMLEASLFICVSYFIKIVLDKLKKSGIIRLILRLVFRLSKVYISII
jgi:hypothetical protein